MVKISLKYAPALRGGVALVTTFFGLLVTSILFDGLSISGATAWVVGTLIVWLGAVIAAIVLPLFLFKKAMGARRDAGR
jgi:F0F1-type ATP synthase assembly protein I